MVYCDDHCIVDLDKIAFASCVDGVAEYDGFYIILFTLYQGECKFENYVAPYTSREQRDAGFKKLGAMMTANQRLKINKVLEGFNAVIKDSGSCPPSL